jgi:hypothetical protein
LNNPWPKSSVLNQAEIEVVQSWLAAHRANQEGFISKIGQSDFTSVTEPMFFGKSYHQRLGHNFLRFQKSFLNRRTSKADRSTHR